MIVRRIAIGSAAVAAAIALAACSADGGAKPSGTTAPTLTPVPGNTSTGTASTGRTTAPPWAAPADASASAKAAGLPMLGAEGQVLHIHSHLDIIVDGRPVAVPADIGVDQARQQISPLHTHDGSGVVHIESPVKAEFTLGQVMAEWDVAFGKDVLGGLRAGSGNELHVYVNGKEQSGNPAAIKLADHQEIAVVYGATGRKVTVPSTYAWPAGG